MYPKSFLFLITMAVFGAAVYCGPVIEEKDVPLPESPVELPPALIGEFVIVSPVDECVITIFPNNKYIMYSKGIDMTGSYKYGHVILRRNDFYFNPIEKGGYLQELTEINVSDNGFSFKYTEYGWKEYFIRGIRRVPVPENLPDITLEKQRTEHQYFVLPGMVKPVNEIYLPSDYWYSLDIDNGLVVIYQKHPIDTEFAILWQIWRGFLKLERLEGSDFTGVIQFTNTPGYYHSADGTARIEKRGESIKLTMLCSVEIETIIREKYPAARPPFYMVMEF